MELRWPKIINKYGNPPKIKSDQDKPSSNQPVTDVKPTSNQHKITDLEPTSLSSSRFLNKNTSTKEKIEQVLQDHPELGYWRQKNITPKQIQNWLKISHPGKNQPPFSVVCNLYHENWLHGNPFFFILNIINIWYNTCLIINEFLLFS
jgi:hypothetical protein